MGFIKSYGTYSSNGIQTTSSANTIVVFDSPIYALIFTNEGTTNLTIKFNDEINTHLIKPDCTLSIEDMAVNKVIIVENGVSYSYSALRY